MSSTPQPLCYKTIAAPLTLFKAAYSAEKVLGRMVLICANLKPRKMKFGISEGMVLAAGDGGNDLFILSPDVGAKVGSKVK